MFFRNKKFRINSLSLVVFLIVLGFFIFNSSTNAKILNVGPGESHTTITSAINSANSGDTINIASGVYDESLLINKLLTLTSDGIKPIITGDSSDYIIKIEGINGVVLNNLEINGLDSVANPNTFKYGVLLSNAGTNNSPVEIKNSIIKNIWNIEGSGIGVEDNSYVLVHDNLINLFRKNGIRFVSSQGKFYGNTVKGETVNGINRVQNLVNLRSNSNVEIYNNTITNAFTSIPSPKTLFSPCVFVNAYPDGIASFANIYNNNISFCDVGVIVTTELIPEDNSSAIITNNNFSDLYLGTSFQQKESGSATMTDNSFINVVKQTNRLIETPEVEKIGSTPTVVPIITNPQTEARAETVDETPLLVDNMVGSDTEQDKNLLTASAGSVFTLGTNNNIVGILFILIVLFLVGYISKRYIKN